MTESAIASHGLRRNLGKRTVRCINRLAQFSLAVLVIGCSVEEPTNPRQVEQASAEAVAPEEAQPSTADIAPVKQATQSTASSQRQIAALQPALGDLDALADRRVIRVLTVYSVGRYFLDGPRESGLVKEAATQLETFVNEQLKPEGERIHVVIIPVARDQLIPALLAGRGDIVVAGLSITEDRGEKVTFSIPASKPLSEILITGPTAPELADTNGLSGKTVYLRKSSSYRESVEALNKKLIANGKAPVAIEFVSEFLEDDDLVEMVNAGLLPWAVVDDYKLPWWKDVFTHIQVRDDIILREGSRTAWAIRPNSPQLESLVNDFLRGHREGTLLGNILKNRYFRDFDWAAKATDNDAMARYHSLREFFHVYGGQYAVDPLMLAAQGYQESRLDQSARNRFGAIGIMQIKQSTANDPKVNIPNIEEAEFNIHAGTKYLAFLRDRYFDKPEIDSRDQLFLALAAYNMGPARMIKVRRQAQEMGYDPNRWYDHVEIAAAKHVGREPVTYVANISKYYLAYTMAEQQIALHEEAREGAGIKTPSSEE